MLWNQCGMQQNFNIIKVRYNKNTNFLKKQIFEYLGKNFVNILRPISSLSFLFERSYCIHQKQSIYFILHAI